LHLTHAGHSLRLVAGMLHLQHAFCREGTTDPKGKVPMAYIASAAARHPGNPIIRLLSRALGGLSSAAARNPRLLALTRLGELTDEELAARGLTREAELRRILAGRFII